MKDYLLMSGGLDSSTLAYQLKIEQQKDIEGLFIDYGQPTSSEEFERVQEIGQELEIQIRKVDLSTIWRNFEENGLDPLAVQCTETSNIYAPLLMAATFAAAAGGNKLYSAFHKTDEELYPATFSVLKAQEKVMQAVNSNLTENFEFITPFSGLTKDEVISKGFALNVPFEKTLSCLNPNKIAKGHCGECNSCKTRKMAFEKVKIADKTKYFK
jgi:7-cyano-7-deazaguanine synthase